MFHEQKKIVKIVAELTTYFLAIGADEISSSIAREGEEGTICFRANYDPSYGERLRDMEKCLNEQRNDEIGDIYWELAGSGDPGDTNQLLLVGMMIDKAEIRMEDGFVNLKLHKKLWG